MDIRFLVMDVDGTLTDGNIYISENGELFKSFNVKDGYGIHELLPNVNGGIIPVIITGRSSNITEKRCKELGILSLYQGVKKKEQLYNIIATYNNLNHSVYTLSNVAYIGDDMNDLEVMKIIKEAGGSVGCPGDAVNEVKALADFISEYYGGHGAVRDYIEYVINKSWFYGDK